MVETEYYRLDNQEVTVTSYFLDITVLLLLIYYCLSVPGQRKFRILDFKDASFGSRGGVGESERRKISVMLLDSPAGFSLKLKANGLNW